MSDDVGENILYTASPYQISTRDKDGILKDPENANFRSKPNSIGSFSSQFSASSSSSLLSSEENYLTCKICLNKFRNYEFGSPVNTSAFSVNSLYQIESCKCKFCINVRLAFNCN